MGAVAKDKVGDGTVGRRDLMEDTEGRTMAHRDPLHLDGIIIVLEVVAATERIVDT